MSKAHHAQCPAVEAEFAARIEKIRTRFVLKFADRVEQIRAALSQMTGDGSDAANAVASSYHWFHEICGISSTIGFEATGLQAQSCASILLGAFRAQRGLSPDEAKSLTGGLESFRIAAQHEMQSILPGRRSAL
jgi:hypothetical protein